MDKVMFEWAVPLSQAEALRHDLFMGGGELGPNRDFVPPVDEQDDYTVAAFEPLTMIVGAIAVGYLVEKLTAVVRNAKHGGAIVDVRSGRVEIRSNPSIPGGTILVVSDQGVSE